MLTTLVVLIVLFLAVQTLPVAIGVDAKGNWLKAIMFVFILSLLQGLSYWLGLKLGSTFMHLMVGFKGAVFLSGFLLIGIRMLMETISIRKGERTYSINTIGLVILASLAQSANTFLAGLLFNYIDINQSFTLLLILIVTTIISIFGIILKPEKYTLTFASLLYAIGGTIIIISSIYITFFIF